MHPQISALYELQKQDRQLTVLERKLGAIPARLKELDDDLQKLESMLDGERSKFDETLTFQRSQETQLGEEEHLIQQSKARMNQVKTARELNATQRELEATRRMAASRADEIQKLKAGVGEAQDRIDNMEKALGQLRAKADEEKTRLGKTTDKLKVRIEGLRKERTGLTEKIDTDTLRKYERIRTRMGGIAFVSALRERCSACKMVIPHQMYVQLRKGEDILACENCGRLLYFGALFEDETAADGEAKPKVRPKPSPDVGNPGH